MQELFFYGESAALAAAALCLFAAVYLERRRGFWRSAEAIGIALWSGVVLLFPLPAIPLLAAYSVIVHRALGAVNRHKIDLTNNPVMPRDLRTAISNPRLMCDLTDIPHWVGGIVVLAIVLAAASVLAAVLFSLPHTDWRLALARMMVLGAIVAYAGLARARFVEHLHGRFAKHEFPFGKAVQDRAVPSWKAAVAMWTPSFNSTLSLHLGAVPFLIFKSGRNTFHEATIFRKDPSAVPVSASRIASSIPQHERMETPNIVVLQVESGFNPNWAFQLDSTFDSFLFQRNRYTRFVVPLHVNVVGGGSWVSEFEFLTGLDTRLFGDEGLYTHIALPKLIKQAFPSYLQARGFRTCALFPVLGSFYNSRRAFEHYGFDTFWDSADLSLPDWHVSDVMMADAFRRKVPEMADSPFFAYIVTNGAHSPFRSAPADEPHREPCLPATATPSMSGKLRDYLALLRNSEQAARSILEDLEEVERRTGRHFVLLLYGDHQPWDFVTSKNAAFDAVRTAQPKTQTFAHLMSSKGRFDIDSEIPATLLPSIVSCFVTGSTADLYLPINFYLFQQAGADMFKAFGSRSRLARNLIWEDIDSAPDASAVPLDTDSVAGRQVREAQSATIQWLRKSPVLDMR